MKKSYATKLVKALRSGEYGQTSDVLSDGTNFCCLGIVCELSGVRKKNILAVRGHNARVTAGNAFGKMGVTYGANETAALPPTVMKKFGFFTSDGQRRDGMNLDFPGRDGHYASLAEANDDDVPFKEIADYIEANYKEL